MNLRTSSRRPGTPPDVDAAVRRALAERPDVVEARTQIAIGETNIKLAKNGTLPDVRVQATYLTTGLGGFEAASHRRVSRNHHRERGHVVGHGARTGAPGRLPDLDGRLDDEYPIGKSAEEANLARTRIERDQAQARLRDVELVAVREVRDAALRVEQNRQRIDTTQLGRELAEQRLDAEQKRFEVGMSTSFLVIQAQRDLAVARNNELQASLQYQLSLVNFQTAQQTALSQAAVFSR